MTLLVRCSSPKSEKEHNHQNPKQNRKRISEIPNAIPAHRHRKLFAFALFFARTGRCASCWFSSPSSFLLLLHDHQRSPSWSSSSVSHESYLFLRKLSCRPQESNKDNVSGQQECRVKGVYRWRFHSRTCLNSSRKGDPGQGPRRLRSALNLKMISSNDLHSVLPILHGVVCQTHTQRGEKERKNERGVGGTDS